MRNRFRRPLLIFFAALSLVVNASCAVNPATGEQSFTGFMSEEDEQRIGAQEHPKILQQFGGAYDDPRVSGYVAELGFRLLKVSETPDATFHFTVLDSDVVNAFALPGGYVYISRGLIALAENEAELAGVVGHEIGHVTARHPAQRYSQAVATNIGLTIVGILGSAAGLPGNVNNVLSAGANAILSGYSREQELEADMLGVRYLSRAGYDPTAARTFFEKMAGNDELRSKMTGRPTGEESFNFGSSHPRTSDRIQQAIDLADNAVGGGDNRERFLREIDGMIFGDSPAQGIRRGRDFYHGDLAITFRVPDEFVLSNSPSQVVAQHPDGPVIIFDMEGNRSVARSASDLRRYLVDQWAAEARLRLGNVERIAINGMEAWTGNASANTRSGARDVRLVAIRGDAEQIFRLVFITPPDKLAGFAEGLQRTTYSFRRLSGDEIADLKPLRIRTREVAANETIPALVGEMDIEQFADEWFDLINKNELDGAPLAGKTVKLIRE